MKLSSPTAILVATLALVVVVVVVIVACYGCRNNHHHQGNANVACAKGATTITDSFAKMTEILNDVSLECPADGVMALPSQSHAQIGQDLHVINNIYKGRRGGYFVDVGAHDGISLSNTYLLERDYAWTGLCIEAMPGTFAKLEQLRTASKCYRFAVYSRDDEELEFVEADMFSGIVSHIDSHTSVLKNTKIHVKTKTLTTLLDESSAPHFIEYLSLDTEGSELEILRGIDFAKYQFGYINLEHNYVEPRRSQMRQLLESNGYVYDGENHWDDNYRWAETHQRVKGMPVAVTSTP